MAARRANRSSTHRVGTGVPSGDNTGIDIDDVGGVGCRGWSMASGLACEGVHGGDLAVDGGASSGWWCVGGHRPAVHGLGCLGCFDPLALERADRVGEALALARSGLRCTDELGLGGAGLDEGQQVWMPWVHVHGPGCLHRPADGAGWGRLGGGWRFADTRSVGRVRVKGGACGGISLSLSLSLYCPCPLVNVTCNVTLVVTWLVTLNVTCNVTLVVTWLVTLNVTYNVTLPQALTFELATALLTCCRGGRGSSPLRLLGRPGLARLLGDRRVVQAAVRALNEAAQRALPQLAPGWAGAAEAGQEAVIVGQRAGGHLGPGDAPQRHRGLELVARGQGHQVGVAQPQHVEGHEPEVAQVYLGGDKWSVQIERQDHHKKSERGEGNRRKDSRSPARTRDQPMRSFHGCPSAT